MAHLDTLAAGEPGASSFSITSRSLSMKASVSKVAGSECNARWTAQH